MPQIAPADHGLSHPGPCSRSDAQALQVAARTLCTCLTVIVLCRIISPRQSVSARSLAGACGQSRPAQCPRRAGTCPEKAVEGATTGRSCRAGTMAAAAGRRVAPAAVRDGLGDGYVRARAFRPAHAARSCSRRARVLTALRCYSCRTDPAMLRARRIHRHVPLLLLWGRV